MHRMFRTHHIRKAVALPGLWDLEVPGHHKTKIPVPCCVESIPEFSNYKGPCTLKTASRFGGDALLTFMGVGHTAEVRVDGETVGDHYGAYGAFSILLKDLEDRAHEISLNADNAYSEASALHVENDFYSYLGITRPVILEELNTAYIKWIHITPKYTDGKWSAEVRVCAEDLTDTELDATLRLFLSTSDEYAAGSRAVIDTLEIPIRLGAGETREFTAVFHCEDVKPYSPEEPILYYIHAWLCSEEGAFDDLIDRFGFREVRVQGTDIIFNGDPLKIKGFNRHEDYAEFGSCIPVAAMYRDVQLMKEAGANCVRTCHYPNDERFLDICDEMGLLVWEEGHGRGLDLEKMRNPNFMPQSRLTISEMICQHYNHPSIYVWGLLNECASETKYGRACYKELIELMRSMDASRPITFASNRLFNDLCLDLVDIVSYNIYPQWYFKHDVTDYVDQCLAYAREHEGEGKPLLISEIGAGAIYGYLTNIHARWSEEYQVDALEAQITGVMEHPECCGVIIWQFCDCRVDDAIATHRPKTQNNKGVVDIYRREKLGYFKVQELFRKY